MKKIKKLSYFIPVLLAFFITWGNFSLPALAYEKWGVNFEQVKNEFLSKVTEQTSPALNSSIEKTINKQSGLEEKQNHIGVLDEFSSIKQRNKNYIEGEVLVKYKSDKINLNTVFGKTAALNFISSNSLEKKEDLTEANMSLLKIKDDKTVEEKIAELKNDPNIEYIEPNYIKHYETINTDDTYKDLLWGLDNTGQSVNGVVGINDADIDGPEAWTITEATTSAPVIVAIIDSGVAYNHPDLANNMWDGTNCVDENDSPFGGCQHGYDYEDTDKIPLPTTSSHGTHIAGTIAATKNNSKGIIGVAPQAKIMAIKFGLDVASEIKAIDFAIQNGAKIINASFAGVNFSQPEYEAINRFKTAGGIFVAAAGNCGDANTFLLNGCTSQNQALYPASYDLSNIISVAATDQQDNLATFSNYGLTSIDVGAPGTNIYSTVADTIILNETFEEVTPPSVPSGWIIGGTNNNWGTYNFNDGFWNKVLYGDLAYPSYANNTNSTITSLTYNLGGNTSGATISFLTACDTEYTTTDWRDYMQLEFSSDGISFPPYLISPYLYLRWDEAFLDQLNGDSNPSGGAAYYFENLPIPSQFLSNNFKFRFRWVTNASDNNYDGCKIDYITITKYSDGSDEKYDYMDGTSMAAPHVAGLAALVWGTKPSLVYTEVKNSILNTGDPLSSLNGKTVTGNRINAFNALDSITPPIISNVQTATTTATSTIVTWTTDLPATSKVAYSTSTPVTSTIVSSSTLATIHSLELTNLTASTTYYYYVESADKYGNIATSTEQQFQTLLPPDIEAPVITSFTIPATSDSLTVPITSFEATDNVEVTGYLLTETSSIPLASDPNWSVATSTTYTFSSEGTKTLYAWAKDAANNISTSSNASVTITLPPPDTSPPILSEITPIATSTNDNTPDYTFHSDEAGTITYGGSCSSSSTTAIAGNNTITFNELTDGYYDSCTITVTDESDNASDPLLISPFTIDTVIPVITLLGEEPVNLYIGDSYTDAGATALDDIDGDITVNIVVVNPVNVNVVGTYIITYNVSDAAGNPAQEVTRTVNVSEAPDTEAPVITSFVIPATSTSLTVPITSFEATDNVGVTGYLLTETSTTPLLDDSNWSAATSTTYTFSSEGFKTLYAWAKDAANNISISSNASVTITFKNITSVSSLNDISVVYGIPFASLTLPETVEVTLDDTSTTTLQVIWTEGTYDSSVSGEYILEGAITLTPEISNSSNLKASVKIIVAPNTAKAITSFKFESLSPEVVGIINEINHTILLTVPYGTNVTILVPTITVSPNATSSPASGVAQDFTNPVTYTVTAEDGTTQNYIVTVVVTPTTTTTTAPPAGGGGGDTTTTTTTTTTTKPSSKIDTNQDGKIDIFDFNSLMINWGKKEGNNIADFDNNGQVDIFDFNLLMINWTQ